MTTASIPCRNGVARTGTGLAIIRPVEPIAPDHLRHFLAARDIPCPACGYNLRDLAIDHCPECGEALFLAVRGLHEPTGPALVRLLAAALPLGFNAIFTAIGVVGAAFSHSWRPDDWLLVGMFGGLSVVFAGMLGRVQRTMPRFRGRARRNQWKRALGLSAIAFLIQAVAIVFMFIVR
jgi:hypothetical protein